MFEGPIGIVHMSDIRVEVPIYLEQARTAPGEMAFVAAWAEGKAMTVDEASA
jgi:hypothetical protein